MLRARSQPLKFRVSVLVPCDAKHVRHLSDLIAAYEAQTVRPDEIVVAGPSGLVGSAAVRIPVQYAPGSGAAGANRNRAAAVAKGDVFLYQDADDLPHPRRVEIVKALFERYELDHLVHDFFRDLADLRRDRRLDDALARVNYWAKHAQLSRITNGNIATSRGVFAVVRWDERPTRREDTDYNVTAIARFPKTSALLRMGLLQYRQNLSSAR